MRKNWEKSEKIGKFTLIIEVREKGLWKVEEEHEIKMLISSCTVENQVDRKVEVCWCWWLQDTLIEEVFYQEYLILRWNKVLTESFCIENWVYLFRSTNVWDIGSWLCVQSILYPSNILEVFVHFLFKMSVRSTWTLT